MIRYIVKRILLLIPVSLGVILIVFLIMQLAPGDPIYALLGSNASPEQYATKEAELGLDKPVLYQFFLYVKNIILHFDLGVSYADGRSVSKIILERFPTTLKLGMLGIAVPIVIGIPLGIIAAVKHNSIFDRIISVMSLAFASMPDFWYSLMMMLLFTSALHWLPASFDGTWKSWIMPVIAVGASPVAGVTRMTRSSMLDVTRQDYVRTARSKGISEWSIIMHHELKNALIPVLTVLGMLLGGIMAGSVIVENLFNVPGMGTMIYGAISTENYPLVQGSVAFLSIFICGVNLIVDVIYAYVDPRIKAQYERKKERKNPADKAVKPAEGGAQ